MSLAVDLFCGLGGWTEGLLAEGFQVVGFDHERHEYGEHRYPAELVLQDVLTLDGAQLAAADLIVASPPCQEFSYMAMPWRRGRQIAAALRGEGEFPDGYRGSRTVAELTRLFDACFRIQREASQAAGRKIPLVVENVRGAQPWVGRARWHHGSYYLWGDVPALMPINQRCADWSRGDGGPTDGRTKFAGRAQQTYRGGSWFDKMRFAGPEGDRNRALGVKVGGLPPLSAHADPRRGRKNTGGSWFNVAHNTTSGHGRNPDGRKAPDGTQWFNDGPRTPQSLASSGSRSPQRKMASALIAKIPFDLARHVARVYAQRAAA